MKKLHDPDVDDVMSTMPDKRFLALVADKSVDRCGPILVYEINIFLVGRSVPANSKRGLTGGECVPISPNNLHLELRSPVIPEAPVPFPYSNCYIHTTIALRCRLAQAHISGPEIPIFTLPKRIITRLGVVKMADLARAEDRLTILKLHGEVRDDLSSIDWEEELRTIRAHIAQWPSDTKEKLTGGDAIYLQLFSNPTYAPQEPGGSRYVSICLNVWTDITQDVTLTNPEEFPDDIDRMIELQDQSNREWLDHHKTKFLWGLDREEHRDRVDHWVQEVDEVAAKPPIDSHLLYQDASTQTDPTAVYTDSGVQTDPIHTSDLFTKEALHVQKPSRLLDAEGNQKRRKKYGSRAQALKNLARKTSPGPIGARLPGREARAKSRMRTKAIFQPHHVAHNANSTHWQKPRGRVRRKP